MRRSDRWPLEKGVIQENQRPKLFHHMRVSGFRKRVLQRRNDHVDAQPQSLRTFCHLLFQTGTLTTPSAIISICLTLLSLEYYLPVRLKCVLVCLPCRSRHVCTREHVVPERTLETYNKPSYIPYQKACNDHSGMCNAVRVVYHEAYRTEQRMHFKKQTTYVCCPGWMQAHKHQHGCRKAICTNPCLNKGSCVQPQTCSCSPGFTGPQCETDINECREKPCDHTCVNTNGSFQCYCHDGFELQEDGRTCRSRGNITATEAKDLLDFELISQRLLRLEEEMHTKKQTSPTSDISIRELANKIESMMQRILDLQDQLDNVKRSQARAHHTLQIVQAYLPQMERINPLCKQVSTIEQEVQSCTCRSGMRYRFKPHNLS